MITTTTTTRNTAAVRNRNVNYVWLEPCGVCRLRKTDFGNDYGGGTYPRTPPLDEGHAGRLAASVSLQQFRKRRLGYVW